MAIIGPAHDPDERVPRHLLSPSAIPRVRRTTVSEFPKSVRRVDGLASVPKVPSQKLSVSLAAVGVVGAVEKLSCTFPSSVGKSSAA